MITEEQWLTIDDAKLVLKNCAWWHSLTGEPPTDNTSSKTIRIARTQLFTVPALNDMMNQVKQGMLSPPTIPFSPASANAMSRST